MLFTSYAFVGFLALTLLAYYLVPGRCQWPLLLAASYVFYWAASPWYLLFILVTTASAYGVSLKLAALSGEQRAYLAAHGDLTREEKRAFRAGIKKRKWAWLLGCLALNIGILAVTKYTNFVIRSLNALTGGGLRPVDMIVPMGISFYTFQTVGYVIDVYRDRQPAQRNFFKLALFVSFFPQLVQGPISRYGQLSETLFTPHRFQEKTFSFGLMRVLWGYFKKVVLADRLLPAVTALTGDAAYTGAYVLAAMLFYAFELYCDFTGGIDITIGIGEAMGIRMPENFDLPYFSKNIREYWNRWHITMGTWFTDYIFYPISVCRPMLRLSKWSREHLGQAVGKRVTVYLSSFAVWLATGIWHGAAWNFVAWGLTNWAVIMISQELEPLYERFHRRFALRGKAPYEAFQVVRTVLLMSAIRMFDCYRDVPLTIAMLGSMFTRFDPRIFTDGSLLDLGLDGADLLVLGLGLAVALAVSLFKRKKGSVRQALYEKPAAVFYGTMAALLVCTVVFGAYGAGYDAAQFIYNRF